MSTEHKNITDPQLHEPKGIAAATVNKVYLSDGNGSGNWKDVGPHIGGYISFDAVGPAYSLAVTTLDAPLNPTFIETTAHQFTSTGTPNARLVFDGDFTVHSFVSFNASIRQASGADRDVEIVLAKNGTLLEGSRIVRTTATSKWGSIALNYDVELSATDYLEIFIKSSVAVTIEFAHAYISVHGIPE